MCVCTCTFMHTWLDMYIYMCIYTHVYAYRSTKTHNTHKHTYTTYTSKTTSAQPTSFRSWVDERTSWQTNPIFTNTHIQYTRVNPHQRSLFISGLELMGEQVHKHTYMLHTRVKPHQHSILLLLDRESWRWWMFANTHMQHARVNPRQRSLFLLGLDLMSEQVHNHMYATFIGWLRSVGSIKL